ncbi:MAG TPA: hypothetical protein VN137_03910, partial [Sphingomonas sp.]|nr:hypothetical protein [Sphingomonas sp.]
MTDRLVTEAELQAYVDGRLSGEREEAVAAWLAERPDEAERVHAYRVQRDALRSALASVVAEPVPPELDLRLRVRPERTGHSR